MSPAAWPPAASVIAAFAAVLASGCGGEDVVVQAAPTPQERGVAAPAGATVRGDPLRGGAPAASRLTITVEDGGPGRFRYRAPRSVRGGLVEIRLRNVGDVPHKAQLWRIEGKHSVREALRIRRPQPDWLQAAGGVSLTAPGATSTSLQSLPATTSPRRWTSRGPSPPST